MLSSSIRFPVAPRDVPPVKAARRLHLTLAVFERLLPELIARGFPEADPTTGHYDLTAIDAWMDKRSGLADHALTAPRQPRDAQEVFGERARRLLDG